MDKYCSEGRITSKEVDGIFVRLELMQRTQKKLADSIKRNHEALDLANEAKRIIDSEVYNLLAERNKQQNSIASYSGRLAGIDTDSLRVLFTGYLDMKLSTCHEEAFAKRSSAKTHLPVQRLNMRNFAS